MMQRKHGSTNWRVLFAVLVALPLAAVALRQVAQDSGSGRAVLLAPAQDSISAATESAPTSGDIVLHPVHINRAAGPPALVTDQLDLQGNPITINCSTCHSIKTPDFANRATADLDEFHQDLTVAHGMLTCLSCHNADDYDALRLADGSTLEYTDVMTLCGQCHGPQLRDYNQGVHGGTNGYWDRTRGPQYRNNCINCHDPHAPAFPMMQPTFKPIDRYLNPQHRDDERESHG